MSTPAAIPGVAPLADAPPAAVGAGSPTTWLVGGVLALTGAGLAASQHVARAFRFDPRLGVPQVGLPASVGTLLTVLAIVLGVAAVAVAVKTKLTRESLPLALGLAYGAALATSLGPPAVVAPWGAFVWLVRFGGAAQAQPVLVQSLGIFAVGMLLGGALLAIVAGRAQAADQAPSGTFGTAVWGDGAWFRPSRGRPGHGIPIGYRDGENALLYDDTGAHTFVCAPTGAGKTVGFAVPTLLSHRGSTIVLDVKGELFAVTARHRREGLGQRVRRIDPFQAAGDGNTDSFNPLDTVVTEFDLAEPGTTSLDREEAPFAFDNAKMISEMLVAKSGEEKEPFFVDNARQFLTGLILLVACDERRTRDERVPDFTGLDREQARRAAAGELPLPDFRALYALDAAARGGEGSANEALPTFPGMPVRLLSIPNRRRSLVEVRRKLMLPDSDLRELLETMVAHPHPVVQGRGAQFARMDERTFSSVVATVRSHTEFLDSPAIQSTLELSSFDFRELKDDPTSVFLVMPVERLDNYSRFVRVLVGCAQARLLAVRYKPRYPVLFLLDEFPRLQKFEKIDEGLSAHRGFGIQYLIVVQSVAQLEEAYGPLWRNFITNTTLQILWSPNDDQACKFISDTAGDRTVSYVEVSENLGKQGRAVLADSFSSGSSRTLRETKRKLIEPDEARTLDQAFCFVFSRGHSAVIAKRPNYLTDAVFRGLFDPNPYHSDGQKEVLVSAVGAALVQVSKTAFRDAPAARRKLLRRLVEAGPDRVAQEVRERPDRFGTLAGHPVRDRAVRDKARTQAVAVAAAASRYVWTEGEERVREMLALPPAPDLDAAARVFRTASEALFAYPSAARAQFAERCRTDSPAKAARALREDPSWAGPLAPGLGRAERERLSTRFAASGSRYATIRGTASVGDAFAA